MLLTTALLLSATSLAETPEPVRVLKVDASRTVLHDDQGLEVDFCAIDGTFTVVEEDAPFVLDVRDTRCRALNRQVLVPLATYELWPMTKLETSIYYDTTFFEGVDLDNSITWDYLGNALEVEIDDSQPGVVHVRLDSPQAGINILPGPAVEIMFNLAPHVKVGDESQLELSHLSTRIQFKNGETHQLELRPGTVTIVE